MWIENGCEYVQVRLKFHSLSVFHDMCQDYPFA